MEGEGRSMALLQKRIQVFKLEKTLVGELDLTVDGFYRNVLAFKFDVKKRKALYIEVRSDAPIDVAVADSGGSALTHRERIAQAEIGPVPTGNNRDMGIIFGVFPGEKATVEAEIWMDKE
ncbi:MAG: hypothetical protein LBV63_01600 [Candidatus Methanoplasma sp.]|jgi:hypothetical protein|nr:hypothetical protein [Candidatus Methanoplasma sp.]